MNDVYGTILNVDGDTICLLYTSQLPVNVAQIGQIEANSPAAQYGLEKDDVIQQIQIVETGESILVSNFEDVHLTQDTLKTKANTLNMKITVLRDNQKKVIRCV